ncbi:MAG: hypothetical protein ACYC7E_10520 [Armatimonadota bacterium]
MAKAAPKPTVTDPLAVIPLQPEGVEQKRDSRGMLHLRLHAEPPGLVGKVARWMHYDYTRKVELDEYGTYYYSLIDGQTPLKKIIRKMADYLGVSRDETEKMVILFTKKLMTMNMLALKVPEGAYTSEAHR